MVYQGGRGEEMRSQGKQGRGHGPLGHCRALALPLQKTGTAGGVHEGATSLIALADGTHRAGGRGGCVVLFQRALRSTDRERRLVVTCAQQSSDSHSAGRAAKSQLNTCRLPGEKGDRYFRNTEQTHRTKFQGWGGNSWGMSLKAEL